MRSTPTGEEKIWVPASLAKLISALSLAESSFWCLTWCVSLSVLQTMHVYPRAHLRNWGTEEGKVTYPRSNTMYKDEKQYDFQNPRAVPKQSVFPHLSFKKKIKVVSPCFKSSSWTSPIYLTDFPTALPSCSCLKHQAVYLLRQSYFLVWKSFLLCNFYYLEKPFFAFFAILTGYLF